MFLLLLLLSIIIYVIIILYYRIYHKFWFYQPVDFPFSLETEEGKIKTLDYVHKYNKNYICEPWKNSQEILGFLNKYFQPNGELYKYSDYSIMDSIVYKITKKDSSRIKEICGCISVKPIELYIYSKKQTIFYVDHLNVKESERGQGLATDLISFVVDRIGDQIYLFKKDIHPLPFKYFCKYQYYLVLNSRIGNILPNKINLETFLEKFSKKNNFKIFANPTKDCIFLEKDNQLAIIFYTNILDSQQNPIYEIAYCDSEYIGQLSVNYIQENFPRSKIILNSLAITEKYFEIKKLSENFLYFYNFRISQINALDIFLTIP